MKSQYLEIVTKDVDAVCTASATTNEVQFGEPDAGMVSPPPLDFNRLISSGSLK